MSTYCVSNMVLGTKYEADSVADKKKKCPGEVSISGWAGKQPIRWWGTMEIAKWGQNRVLERGEVKESLATFMLHGHV